MSHCIKRAVRFAATVIAAAGISAGAVAQSTFTYQGQLKSSGAPYNGTADLRFTLYTAASGGAVVGAPQAVINSSILDGLFTATLDFGAAAFNGPPRWLQIEVQTPSTGGAGPYSPLNPRQPVTPAPYAMYALNASISGVQPNAVSFTNASNAFSGSGLGLTSLNASGISTGTLNIARFPTSGSWPLTDKLSIDGGMLTVSQTGALPLVGVGTEFPQFPLHIHSNGFGLFHGDGLRAVASYLDATGGYFGTYSDHPFHLYTNNGNAQVTLTTAGNVGIGTSAPDGRLQVVGGPAWTTHGWNKTLNIGNGHAVELATATTRFGMGATSGLGTPSMYFFHTASDGATATPNYYMVHTNTGQVGIGTTTVAPVLKLHVFDSVGGHQAVRGDAPNGNGLVGTSNATALSAVAGVNSAIDGIGVYGEALASSGQPAPFAMGVWGISGVNGVGVKGNCGVGGVAVLGEAPAGATAVGAFGDMAATGTKDFRIDHPLDPENKYLYHHCSEGPDPLNVYSGTVITDVTGQAWVQLPDYFEAINLDPRYQLTAIGAPAPNLHIAQEVTDNSFLISGAAPGMKVSWRIEAVRNDRWVQTHGVRVEVDKPVHLRGTYQHPELYGLGDDRAERRRIFPPVVAPDPASVEQ